MSTILNAFNCIVSGGNTGVSTCAIDIKRIKGAILLPSGFSFTPTNLSSEATFLSALQAATLAAKGSRAYPIHDFEEISDNTEKPVIQTLGYGGKAVVREGYYDWTFQIIKGGFCLAKALRKFNNQNVDVLFIDDNDLLFGKKDSAGNLYGIPQAYVYQAPFKVNDGSKTSIYNQQFVFKPDFVDSIGFVQLNAGDFDTVVGLQDVVLQSGGARAANVSLVKAVTSCGGVDIHSLYASQLAAANMWVATDSVSGNNLTITSVADNTNIGGWTITVDTSDPDYNAAHPVVISMAVPSVLNAAGVLAIESNSLTTPN